MLRRQFALPIAALALTLVVPSAGSAQAAAPAKVTKDDLPTRAQAQALTPKQDMVWMGIGRANNLQQLSKKCEEGRNHRMPGKSVEWMTGISDADLENLWGDVDDTANDWNSALHRASSARAPQPITYYGVAVQRARTPQAARRAFNAFSASVRACPVLKDPDSDLTAKIKVMRIPVGGKQRFGFSIRMSQYGMSISQGMAMYRKGRTVVSVYKMSMTKGQSYRPTKKLVRLALRRGF